MIEPNGQAAVGAMHAAMGRRMAVVAFWVYHTVLVDEVRYHSHMLRATAWDIATQARMIGFSGTKDGCALMPVTLAFEDNPDPRIAGSTERMSRLIERHCATDIVRLADEEGSAAADGSAPPADGPQLQSQAKQLVHAAITRKCDVLIDVGALLAGALLSAVAEHACALIEATHTGHRGVCFCGHDGQAKWAIMDVGTRLVTPLESAPLTPAECFVIYDQARCRGADLKLRTDARALVSLAQGTQRDALLQAVGRLRAFGRNQTIEFVATAGVGADIDARRALAPAEPLPANVLRWAVSNTDEALSHAIPEYVSAAAHHLDKSAAAAQGRALAIPTPTACAALYSRPYGKIPCREYVSGALGRFGTDRLAAQVTANLLDMAADLPVPTGTANSTAERELQQETEREREQEKEREVEEPPVPPFPEPLVNTDVESIDVAQWCEMATGLQGLGSSPDFSLCFNRHFHHVEAAVNGDAPQRIEGRPPVLRLRRATYVYVKRAGKAFVFMTQFQAAAFLRKTSRVVIDYTHAPLALLMPTASEGSDEAAWQIGFMRDYAPLARVLARFFNGETDYSCAECDLLRHLRAPIAAAAATMAAGSRASSCSAADTIFYFLKCRRTVGLLGYSPFHEVCRELVHEAAIAPVPPVGASK